MTNFRDYQVQINKAQDAFLLSSEQKAQIIAPTGAGKTICFTDLIQKAINTGSTNILVVHPRLALSMDQQERLAEDLSTVKFTSFHSGGVVNTDNDCSVNTSTTSVADLKATIDHAKVSKVPHITFSSYHSLNKIADYDFDLIICDEAHYLMQSKLQNCVWMFKSKTIFYTATPVESDTGMTMTDGTDFGSTICNILPKDLIADGFLVAPKVQLMEVQADGNDENEAVVIAEAFKNQVETLDFTLPHKMLVAMPSTTTFKEIRLRLNEIREIAGDVDVYTITASEAWKNSSPSHGRKAVIDMVKESTKPCILIHCDTVAEGMDVPGLTGVFFYRGLSKSKFGQTMGRAARPHFEDLIDGGLAVKPFADRIKKNYAITIPTVNSEPATNTDWKTIIEAFTSYGDFDTMIVREATKGGEQELSPVEELAFVKILDIKFKEEVIKTTSMLEDM